MLLCCHMLRVGWKKGLHTSKQWGLNVHEAGLAALEVAL